MPFAEISELFGKNVFFVDTDHRLSRVDPTVSAQDSDSIHVLVGIQVALRLLRRNSLTKKRRLHEIALKRDQLRNDHEQ